MRLTSVLFFLFFLFCSNLFSQDSLQKVVPNEVLLMKANKHNYSISPNGKLFIEVKDTNTDSDLFVVDIDNYKLLHKIPFGSRMLDNVYWLTNNRLLYESLGAIYAIDIDGSNPMKIVSRITDIKVKGWSRYYQNFQYNKLLNLIHH